MTTVPPPFPPPAPRRPDRIHLRDHVVTAEIGAFQTERGAPQRLRFGISVDLAESVDAAGDDVDRILSYDRLTEAVAAALADDRANLVETLAERIAATLLDHPRAAEVTVTVEKLDRAPGALGVTITRHMPRVAANGTSARKAVILVGGEHAQIDPGRPVVVVPQAAAAGPDCADPAAARRIALLAFDQAAWAMAAGNAALIVADSRTEIDWAVAEQRVAIWAPARMAADAEVPAEPAALGFWLASRIGAARIEFDLPADAELPTPPEGLDIPVARHGD